MKFSLEKSLLNEGNDEEETAASADKSIHNKLSSVLFYDDIISLIRSRDLLDREENNYSLFSKRPPHI
jgi:hypothetical protein